MGRGVGGYIFKENILFVPLIFFFGKKIDFLGRSFFKKLWFANDDSKSFKIYLPLKLVKVPVLSSSTQLSREEENISEEINKYFKEHLLYRYRSSYKSIK